MEKAYNKFERGVPVCIPVSVFDKDNKPIDLTGQPIYFTIKPVKFDYDRDDRFAVVAKNFISNFSEINSFVIELTAKDMDFAPGAYYFDIIIGAWRAATFTFDLVGGPTNRAVLDYTKDMLGSIKAPLKIIQKAEKPIIIVSEINPFLANIVEEITADKYYPVDMRKVYGADRLYELWYNQIEYRERPELATSDVGISGGCSAVRKGDFVGRNFDWLYDDSATFVVHAPRIGSHYAFSGVARMASLTEEVMKSGIKHKDLRALPNYVVDGVNEFGLYANTNVTSLDYGAEPTIPDVELRERVENRTLVRYILDHFKTIQEAVQYIKNYVSVYPAQYLLDQKETLHLLLADNTGTAVLEFIHGKPVVVDAAYMTNFNVYGITPNQDRTVYTPGTQDATHDAIKTNNVTPNGVGLERYNLIAAAYPYLETRTDFYNLMNDLRYTRAYRSSPRPSDPYWFTEAIGVGTLAVNSSPERFEPVIKIMDELYQKRTRKDSSTWQTIHRSIYDLRERKLYVQTQEDSGGHEYEFSL